MMMKINEQFIENIVNSYENFDISEEESENEKFYNAIEDTVNKIISFGEENSIFLYKDKIDNEIPIIRTDRDIVGSSLLFSLFISMYDYILRKYYKENKYDHTLSKLLKHSIKIYQDIQSLILTRSVDGIISRLRTIYETWVIQEFIIKNKQLADIFREHKRIIAFKLSEEMGSKLTKKDEKIKTELIKKYGEDFIHDFGWTSSVIKNIKKRNPQGLVNLLNLEPVNNYNYIYKISCQFVHTTSISIFSDEDENIEMIDVFYITTAEIILNMFISFMNELNVNNKDKFVIIAILCKIIEEIKNME
jgi:hypothetical protein